MLALWRLPEHDSAGRRRSKLRLADALALLRDPAFWRFMVFILTSPTST
jgi:OHS family lactose permease-like MFS transporter